MANLIVILLSDQTIPNIQFIKEKQEKNTDFLFVGTDAMEKKNVGQWIRNVCNIPQEKTITKIVNQFSFSDIKSKLYELNYGEYDRIFVNVTGGTKIMSMGVADFFKQKNSDIYYLTGSDCIHFFPEERKNTGQLVDNVSVKDYLTAYGFTYSESQLSGFTLETAKTIFEAFCKDDIEYFIEARKFIQSKRKKKVEKKDFNKIAGYLNFINYKPVNDKCLSEAETKYLSGDWFEEYVGLTIKHELNLSDDDLLIGTIIAKERIYEGKNSTRNLLGDDAVLSEQNFNNEMDVMFYYKNKFYSIECKSSIISYKKVEINSQIIDKPYNILGETIYKSDSLQSRFGLSPNTAIVTLSDFKTYWKDMDKGKMNNKTKEMEELINRANHSKIMLVDKTMLQYAKSIFNLIK